MSVEDVGRRLLGSVKSQNLFETLKFVRQISRAGETRTLFGIRELDALLPPNKGIELEPPTESTQYESDELIVQAIRKQVDARSHSTVLELTSNESCSSKSALLHRIVAHGVLPIEHQGFRIGGKNSLVIVLDADSRLDLVALRECIRKMLAQSTFHRMTVNDEFEKVITDSLQRVLLFRPDSFRELVATLDYLSRYLAQSASGLSIHSIILDSANAFYWQVKAEQDAQSIAALDKHQEHRRRRDGDTSSGYLGLTKRLNHLSSLYECPVIATTWDLSAISGSDSGRLNSALPTTPAARLKVHRTSVRKFANHTSIDAANSLKASRAEAVDGHEFVVANAENHVVINLRSGYIQASRGFDGS